MPPPEPHATPPSPGPPSVDPAPPFPCLQASAGYCAEYAEQHPASCCVHVLRQLSNHCAQHKLQLGFGQLLALHPHGYVKQPRYVQPEPDSQVPLQLSEDPQLTPLHAGVQTATHCPDALHTCEDVQVPHDLPQLFAPQSLAPQSSTQPASVTPDGLPHPTSTRANCRANKRSGLVTLSAPVPTACSHRSVPCTSGTCRCRSGSYRHERFRPSPLSSRPP
jgi:hypothetical protein